MLLRGRRSTDRLLELQMDSTDTIVTVTEP